MATIKKCKSSRTSVISCLHIALMYARMTFKTVGLPPDAPGHCVRRRCGSCDASVLHNLRRYLGCLPWTQSEQTGTLFVVSTACTLYRITEVILSRPKQGVVQVTLYSVHRSEFAVQSNGICSSLMICYPSNSLGCTQCLFHRRCSVLTGRCTSMCLLLWIQR